MDISKVGVPEGESTRLVTGFSPVVELQRFPLIVNSPVGNGQKLQHTVGSLRGLEERSVGAKGGVEVGTSYDTPEHLLEARRGSRRLRWSALYHTRLDMEEVAEAGTQMTPVSEDLSKTVPFLMSRTENMTCYNETGCQVRGHFI
jgi:hypothetical protein